MYNTFNNSLHKVKSIQNAIAPIKHINIVPNINDLHLPWQKI